MNKATSTFQPRSTTSSSTGRSAPPGHAARPRCSTPSKPSGTEPGAPRICTPSGSSSPEPTRAERVARSPSPSRTSPSRSTVPPPSGGGREGRDPDAVRLPDGYLSNLRPASGVRARPRLPLGAEHGRVTASTPASRPPQGCTLNVWRSARRDMAIADIKPIRASHRRGRRGARRRTRRHPSEIEESRGQRDALYIRRAIQLQRGLAAGGRIALFASGNRVARIRRHRDAGDRKDHREHGTQAQHHPRPIGLDERSEIHSTEWEWDTTAPSVHWKKSHNFIHHKYTNGRRRAR